MSANGYTLCQLWFTLCPLVITVEIACHYYKDKHFRCHQLPLCNSQLTLLLWVEECVVCLSSQVSALSVRRVARTHVRTISNLTFQTAQFTTTAESSQQQKVLNRKFTSLRLEDFTLKLLLSLDGPCSKMSATSSRSFQDLHLCLM